MNISFVILKFLTKSKACIKECIIYESIIYDEW